MTANDDQSAEIMRLKQELARVTEERDILKNLRGPLARLCAVETGCGTVGDLEGSCRWLIGGQTPLKNVAPGLLRT